MTVCGSCLLLNVSQAHAGSAENCRQCHSVEMGAVHRQLECAGCHGRCGELPNPSISGRGCLGCHGDYVDFFSGPMSSRASERAFAEASYARRDPHFFDKNCNSCHVKSCSDCHGSGHNLQAATTDACLGCHKGYFVGADYVGLAPREYRAGNLGSREQDGESTLAMAPDVHREAGLECADCHSMASLAKGRTQAKTCLDCHRPSTEVVEHRQAAHLSELECYACHSAWGAQEYGTFWLRFVDSPARSAFSLQAGPDQEYLQGVYLRQQGAPPLGLNARGRVSPIRPEFIAYFTQVNQDRPVGVENELLASYWKAYFPHTVRRGTATCNDCHGNRRRFMLEEEKDRIFALQADGMGLNSFWDRAGQELVNGSFFPAERFEKMAEKSAAYKKAYVERWKKFLDHGGTSSGN